MEHKTQAIHPTRVIPPEGNEALVAPVFHSVKYRPKNIEHLKAIMSDRNAGFLYSRAGNPTVRELELLLASIQGRDDSLCVASGIAAISAAAISLVKAGEHILMFKESYKPTRYLVEHILKPLGVRSTIFHMDDRDKIENIFSKDPPKLVLLESPTNPALRVHDLHWITRLCKKSKCISILDNTFAGFHHHGTFDIDIFVHSLTKHACGHSDAMGGAIISDSKIIDQIYPIAMTLGATLDPGAASLILRGMKTYFLRTREAAVNAKGVFQWLKDRRDIENLKYLGDENHPDFKLCKLQMGDDAGTVISFDIVGGEKKSHQFIDALKVFSLTPSMGCVESLVAPSMLLFGSDLTAADADRAGIRSNSVRLAIGIESLQDLIDDLDQAFIAIGGI